MGNDDINFEKYRKPWELDEYWVLKLKFLETYHKEFDIDRLLCLAQTFVNIEILNNKYDENLTALIRKLTEDWEFLRELRKSKELALKNSKSSIVKSQLIEKEKEQLKSQSSNYNKNFTGYKRSYNDRSDYQNYSNKYDQKNQDNSYLSKKKKVDQ